ncbi:hypothetical protein [Photobacterium angustum]|uniref:DNA-binding protein n=1 Tax=Photobacterium angustum TaxID=661 RepID=A0A855SIQ8_PHOAN|nr:hypothetical protein [Photobacterium angustum]KJF83578.1 hypothetical protein UB36_03350 [Photobacterium damselae subsp. damselae]KJG42557.1 hypothetical protein UA35_00710 [Photobacterium angustum]KJG47886.1 hypothetical protein UA31_03350 [Photobacterium angustum]KJG49856.1 hypothetical protein UA30_04840 [Photobacterium angustum]KJG54051.1 hypothetical protein UA34_07310 [Photobacterium angustum]
MTQIQIAVTAPFVTVDHYSAITGIPKGTISRYITEGKIITKKKDKPKEKPLINMVAMNQIAAREAEQLVA